MRAQNIWLRRSEFCRIARIRSFRRPGRCSRLRVGTSLDSTLARLRISKGTRRRCDLACAMSAFLQDSKTGQKGNATLQLPATHSTARSMKARGRRALLASLALLACFWQWDLANRSLAWLLRGHDQATSLYAPGTFHLTSTPVHLSEPKLCDKGKSYSGHIGLKGDSDNSPRRMFYWFFEAQNSPETAPVMYALQSFVSRIIY